MESKRPPGRTVLLERVPASLANGFVVAANRDGLPVFKDHGPADYVCSHCGAVLCEGVRPGRFAGVMFQCHCGALNRWPYESTEHL